MGAAEAWVRVVESLLSTVGAFAWPLAVALIAYWQRDALSRAIDRIRSAKLKDAEVVLDAIGDSVEVETTEVREQLEAGGVTWSRIGVDWNASSPHWALTREKPARAVIDAWRSMTAEMQLLDVEAQANEAYLTPRKVVARLVEKGLLSEELAEAIQDLRRFYHQARLLPASVTIVEAREFVTAAWRLQQTMLAQRLAEGQSRDGVDRVVIER